MTDQEAMNVFTTVAALYPMFNSKGNDDSKRKIAEIWMWKLRKGDYRLTMHLLDKYSSENKYPPTVADILAQPVRKQRVQDLSEDIKKVQEEKSNPETAKLREEKLKKLRAVMGGVLGD